MQGAEIGPLQHPIVTKAESRVLYVDHTDTQSLRRKYEADPNVDVHEIVPVDIVWGEVSLAEALGPGHRLGYVLASHVIEHVPDLIGWLEEVRAVLQPGGRLNLAVPDRRFTFDYLRQETQLADVLAAYLAKARRPQPREIIDFLTNFTPIDIRDAWNGQLQKAALRPIHPVEGAIAVARSALNGEYHDVHCWVFTPITFARLFQRLAEAGLLNLACAGFHDTAEFTFEFFVSLQETTGRDAIVESWGKAVRQLSAADRDGLRAGLAP